MSISVLNRGASGGMTASILVNGLSEADIVTATQKIETPLLPDGYTHLTYIESTGTQYIDTGIKGTSDIGFTATFNTANKIATSGHGAIFGALSDDANQRFMLSTYPTHSGGEFFDGGTGTYDPNLVSDKWLDYSFQGNVLTTPSGNVTTSTATFDTGVNIYIFCRNYKGAVNHSQTKISRFTFYSVSTGDALRDFIPAKRNSDSVLGMYDLVSNTFFDNAGTGSFLAGEEIIHYVDGKTKYATWNALESRHEINEIKDLGLWTVTATNGENTKTRDVQIDVIGLYEIEMAYILWLYRDGDECEKVTGGWNMTNFYDANTTYVQLAKNATNMSIYLPTTKSSTWSKRGFAPANKIDFTGYSSLRAELSGTSDYRYVKIATSLTDTINSPTLSNAVAGLDWGTGYLDISDKAGEYYVVFFGAKGYNTTSGTAYCAKIWLE